jgi:hypothetical protein
MWACRYNTERKRSIILGGGKSSPN